MISSQFISVSIGVSIRRACVSVLIAFACCVVGALKSGADAADQPSQVYVVNTGDGTVSLVDLKSMKELKKPAMVPSSW